MGINLGSPYESNRPMSGLDWVMVETVDRETEWEVWTPDETGAVLGSGKTKAEAMLSAISNMALLTVEMLEGMP